MSCAPTPSQILRVFRPRPGPDPSALRRPKCGAGRARIRRDVPPGRLYRAAAQSARSTTRRAGCSTCRTRPASRLLAQPEGADIGQAINDATRAIEAENEALRDVLPKTYNRLDNRTLFALLKNFNSVPMDIEGDAFGKIYEYFLGKFAMSEGQKGGEFFTPTSIVKLIVEIIEPFQGRIFDPACGSGGMFVQSARFVERAPPRRHRRGNGEPGRTLSIFGQEKVAETVRLCRMNLAVNGLEGDIDQGNSYYEDPHNARVNSISSWRTRRSTSIRWTRSGWPTIRASPSACPRPTTPTTCGSSFSTAA